MKRLIFILPFFLLLILMGCSNDDSDDSDDPQLTSSIVAKWKPVKLEYYENEQLVDSEVYEIIEECVDNLEFKSDGTYVVISYEENCAVNVEDSGTYTFSNNTLSFNTNGEIENYTVSTLTDQDLIFEDTHSENGITYKLIYTFTKLE